jgi:hypothetical protein
MNKQTGKL